MGAETFYAVSKGKNADEAFQRAVNQARDEDGRGGYTGTIAEKHDFIMFHLPEDMTPEEFIQRVQDKDLDGLTGGSRSKVAHAIRTSEDKWGPAVCVDLRILEDGQKKFAFFGLASR